MRKGLAALTAALALAYGCSRPVSNNNSSYIVRDYPSQPTQAVVVNEADRVKENIHLYSKIPLKKLTAELIELKSGEIPVSEWTPGKYWKVSAGNESSFYLLKQGEGQIAYIFADDAKHKYFTSSRHEVGGTIQETFIREGTNYKFISRSSSH